MNFVKNIAIVVCASSFMFAGVGFHMANNYGNLDDGAIVTSSWGVTYDLNDDTSVGWDGNLGMLMMFDMPAGVSLRLGWTADAADACTDTDGDAVVAITDAACAAEDGTNTWFAGNPTSTSVGLGYTWWSGGEGLNTSISTNYDYIMAPDADSGDWEDGGDANYSNLSVTVGFGF